MTRPIAVHICPECAIDPRTISLTAFSMSALGKMTAGDLPPSSSESRFSDEDEASMISFPVCDEPV